MTTGANADRFELLLAADEVADGTLLLANTCVAGRAGRSEYSRRSWVPAYERGGWEATTITLEPGDQLVLYTDGVIDTVGVKERFGEERLARTLSDASGAADAVRRIDQALIEFAHGSQVDDTAVIAVERLPETQPKSAAWTAAMPLESLPTEGGRSIPNERSLP